MNALRPVIAALAALAACAVQAGSITVEVLDRDGKPVQDAVVVLVPAQAPAGARPAPVGITISQEKMQFVPAVSLVSVGTRVSFINNDAWEHHVRGTAAGLQQFTANAGGGFELRLDGKVDGRTGKSADVVLDKPGPVLLGCHIHGSMRGHVYVSDSPWALKTGADGKASFDGVPDGVTQVKVWQADQLLDLPPRTVTLGAAPQKADFKLQVVPRRRR